VCFFLFHLCDISVAAFSGMVFVFFYVMLFRFLYSCYAEFRYFVFLYDLIVAAQTPTRNKYQQHTKNQPFDFKVHRCFRPVVQKKNNRNHKGHDLYALRVSANISERKNDRIRLPKATRRQQSKQQKRRGAWIQSSLSASKSNTNLGPKNQNRLSHRPWPI